MPILSGAVGRAIEGALGGSGPNIIDRTITDMGGTRGGMAALAQRTQRGLIYNKEIGILIRFQYNPEEIHETKTMNWHETQIPLMAMPLLTFSGGGARILTFRILLDAHASPHPMGNVSADLTNIRKLTIPYDQNKTPTVKLPTYASASSQVAARMGGGLADRIRGAIAGDGLSLRGLAGPGEIAGIPPMVKIAYGGRVVKGLLRNLDIREVLHGTTPQARLTQVPTRAWVEFEFIIVEDKRLTTHWKSQEPKADEKP